MRFSTVFAVLALSVSIARLPAIAQHETAADLLDGERAYRNTCANCHGTGGVSVGDVESLAGKPREETVRKLQEFKSGARPATIMHQLAKGYTDEQIELLAGWFAAQKPAK